MSRKMSQGKRRTYHEELAEETVHLQDSEGVCGQRLLDDRRWGRGRGLQNVHLQYIKMLIQKGFTESPERDTYGEVDDKTVCNVETELVVELLLVLDVRRGRGKQLLNATT